jgi:hypothetical protein
LANLGNDACLDAPAVTRLSDSKQTHMAQSPFKLDLGDPGIGTVQAIYEEHKAVNPGMFRERPNPTDYRLHKRTPRKNHRSEPIPTETRGRDPRDTADERLHREGGDAAQAIAGAEEITAPHGGTRPRAFK